jgi:uncharacterized membrane protein YuzA (DUF378 family)
MLRTLRFIVTTGVLVGLPAGLVAGAVTGTRFLVSGSPRGFVFSIADAVNWVTVATLAALAVFALVRRMLGEQQRWRRTVSAIVAIAPLVSVLTLRVNLEGNSAARLGLLVFIAGSLPLTLLDRWSNWSLRLRERLSSKAFPPMA